MITLDEYRELVREHLKGLTEEEIRARYERDTTFAAFVIKTWLAERRERRKKRDTMPPSS